MLDASASVLVGGVIHVGEPVPTHTGITLEELVHEVLIKQPTVFLCRDNPAGTRGVGHAGIYTLCVEFRNQEQLAGPESCHQRRIRAVPQFTFNC